MKKRQSKGAWQVQRERCQIEDATPPDHSSAVSLKNIISRLVKKLDTPTTHWFDELNEKWPELVGPAIADHAKPGRYNKGELVLFVENSVWLSEITYSKDLILQKLQKTFGRAKIKKIRLQVDSED